MGRKGVSWTKLALEHKEFWDKNNPGISKRIDRLLESLANGKGLGKPERLRGDLKGFSSLRIDKKNRLIYSESEDTIFVSCCKGHYAD